LTLVNCPLPSQSMATSEVPITASPQSLCAADPRKQQQLQGQT
jgi:hypothetical protein